MHISESSTIKVVNSDDYNYIFKKDNGNFFRWGNRMEDDPSFSPFGPEILDVEVSTVCSQGCAFCYKSNKSVGKNMTIDTFREIMKVIPKNLTQIAFGIGDLGTEVYLRKKKNQEDR